MNILTPNTVIPEIKNGSECGIRLVPDFGCLFWPIFGQTEEEFLATTIISFFNANGSNQFYIRISVLVIS